MDRKFYVYEHWRPDRGECFYVGKGHGRRANDMRRGRNRWHRFIQAKLSALGTSVEVRIIAEGLLEEEAFAKEIERIAFWRNDGADLVNLTIGGEGPSGGKCPEWLKLANKKRMTGWKPTPEVRAKMSAAAIGNKKGLGKKKPQHLIDALKRFHTGRKRTPEQCARISAANLRKFLGRHHTPESIEKIRSKQVGIPKSEETKARMRKPKSAEHRRKLSALMTGVKRSAETRAKIAENSRKMWAQRKAEKALEIKE